MNFEAKRYGLFMFLYCLVTTTLFLFFAYTLYSSKGVFDDFKLFLLVGTIVLIAQILAYFVQAIKSMANKYLIDKGVECETIDSEVVEVSKRSNSVGMFTFYIKCKYKTSSGEYNEAISSTRFVMASPSVNPLKKFEFTPKVYVDRDNENKYYVCVLVKK